MKRTVNVPGFVLLAAVFVLCGLAALAQDAAENSSRDDERQARQEVEAALAARNEALNRQDTKRVRAFLAPDFTVKLPNGKVVTREEAEKAYVEKPATPARQIEQTYSVEKFKLKGGAAVAEVSFTNTTRLRLKDGSDYEARSRTRHRETWVKTPDGWKLRMIDGLSVGEHRATLNGKKVKADFSPPADEESQQNVKDEDRPLLQAGQALVFIYRLKDSALIKAPVYLDGVKIVEMPGGNFIKVKLAPGTYAFRSDKEPPISLKAEAGRIYFLSLKLKVGFPKGQGLLEVDGSVFGPQAYALPQTLDLKPLGADNIKDPSKIVAVGQ
jgi:ketosteroid isomerase-like protein